MKKKLLEYLGGSNASSFLFSLLVALLLFASMQVFHTQIASSAPLTIAGGFVGSLVFISLLTVGNKSNRFIGSEDFFFSMCEGSKQF
jgi:hypothetical protein